MKANPKDEVNWKMRTRFYISDMANQIDGSKDGLEGSDKTQVSNKRAHVG